MRRKLNRANAFLLGSALAIGAAHAKTWTVIPAHPTTHDPIYLETPDFGSCFSDATRVALAAHRLTVTYSCGSNFEPFATTARIRLGRLPEGTYQVDDTMFTVGPRAAGIQANDFSDLWWNPSESGWGLNIIEHADGMIFATWFLYASDGSPAWYVIPGGSWKDPYTFQGAIYRTSAPAVGPGPWPGGTVVTPVGSATLAFGIDGLAATLTVDGKTVTKKLQRQSF